MKKIILALLSVGFIYNQSMGQACTGADASGSSVCIPNGTVQGYGFQDPSSVPCVVQGVAYSGSDQFTMYTQFTFLGTQTVDSIEFTSITGLPSGICWATNRTNNRFKATEFGCLHFKGTTTAGAGQYKLNLSINAWINGDTAVHQIPPYTVNQAGVAVWLRVQTPGGNCAGVDTSVGTSISEISNDVTFMNVVPNPMTSGSVVSFVAEKNATYTLKLSDISGKVINSTVIEAKPGVNSMNIERNNLPAGLYFISLSDGQSLVTRRFSVVD